MGHATETLQGNPANEPRPDIYRAIFQAYGTVAIPVGNVVTVDFGKFASSLGIEGNSLKIRLITRDHFGSPICPSITWGSEFPTRSMTIWL